jgi:hypothetical protein
MSDQVTLLQALCATTYTVADMRRRLGLLQEGAEVALFNKQTTDVVAAIKATITNRGNESDVAVMMEWEDAMFAQFTASNIRERMLALQQSVEALPVMTLYIPVAFPKADLASMATWCREECAPQLLFDVRIDPKVAGGCAFVWNDTYHDFSFTAQSKKYPGVITKHLQTYA